MSGASKDPRAASVIEPLLERFKANRGLIETFLGQLVLALEQSRPLKEVIHSIRSRVKADDRLANKLLRKLKEAEAGGERFSIVPDTLLERVTDLAGVRILHLYTRQFGTIDHCLRDVFEEQRYPLLEEPFARTWDDESKGYFRSLGIRTEESPTLYTSVHYVVGSGSRTQIACEVQVRTLSEEVWGEVDHAINYPEPIDSVACREQIKALARVTSSATRLVDAIFASVDDYKARP